ncbi:helix-turn-helix domain-containing protein [Terriglobus aquaticus]|uniref:Helix-turn-helix domain-containing protein n=1 Tax=Terriglobus aquaticus TaxID=940139 RepID=A0ABW9KMA2_9BACT|nr:AraC family transcriptional regulator [Terriglobus aquaticus]
MRECTHHQAANSTAPTQKRKLFLIQDASRKPSSLAMVHRAGANALLPGPAWIEQDGKRVRILLINPGAGSFVTEGTREDAALTPVCVPPAQLAENGLSPSQFRRVLAFIADRLSRNLKLSDLAREAGLSAAYFSQRFKCSTGTSPHQYLLRLRICKAKTLLEESESPIIDIAAECGFRTQQHFARIFRRLTRVTPTEYRRQRQRSDYASAAPTLLDRRHILSQDDRTPAGSGPLKSGSLDTLPGSAIHP